MSIVMKCDGCGAFSGAGQSFGVLQMQSSDAELHLHLCPQCYRQYMDAVVDMTEERHALEPEDLN